MRVLVEIYSREFRELVPESQTHQNPIFKGRSQRLFTPSQRLSKSRHTRKAGNFPGKAAVFQFVIAREFQRRFDVCSKRKHLTEN